MSGGGGWIAVDLDGTLAGWGDEHPTDVLRIGPPIQRMVEMVKGWLAKGHEVRIFTARVGPATPGECNAALTALRDAHCVGLGISRWAELHHEAQEYWLRYQTLLIERWCLEHLGQILPITATKDFHMWALYDDRAQQVVANQGVLVSEILGSLA